MANLTFEIAPAFQCLETPHLKIKGKSAVVSRHTNLYIYLNLKWVKFFVQYLNAKIIARTFICPSICTGIV